MALYSSQLAPVTVVPLVGTWIETRETLSFGGDIMVVPLVGTWIETNQIA